MLCFWDVKFERGSAGMNSSEMSKPSNFTWCSFWCWCFGRNFQHIIEPDFVHLLVAFWEVGGECPVPVATSAILMEISSGNDREDRTG